MLLATAAATGIAAVVTTTANGLNISDGAGGTGVTSTNSERDANRVSAIWGTSAADGVTPCEIWCDAFGNLLTRST